MSVKIKWDGFSHPNRKVSRRSKLGRFWCESCDAEKVSEGQKCPLCGHICGKQRLKREVLPNQGGINVC